MYLFIDTTEKITLGLIDKNFAWLEFVTEDIKSISSQIHKYIFDLLERNKTNINSIQGLIYCAGPGSYTGMRVSDGLSSILGWQGLAVYTYYQFEIPHLCGVEDGQWISKAFKQEIFVYEWSADQSSKKLVNEEKFEISEKESTYCKTGNMGELELKSSDKLLEQYPERIFETVISRKKCEELFYYRSLEAEFSKQ